MEKGQKSALLTDVKPLMILYTCLITPPSLFASSLALVEESLSMHGFETKSRWDRDALLKLLDRAALFQGNLVADMRSQIKKTQSKEYLVLTLNNILNGHALFRWNFAKDGSRENETGKEWPGGDRWPRDVVGKSMMMIRGTEAGEERQLVFI
jgi:hypothetical protein